MKGKIALTAVLLTAPVKAQVSGDTPWNMLMQGQARQQQQFNGTMQMIMEAKRQRYLEEQQAAARAARAQAEQAYANGEDARRMETAQGGEEAKNIGQLIVDHKCNDARDLALRSGRFDLVEAVGRYCTP